jgi:hypothetical protein
VGQFNSRGRTVVFALGLWKAFVVDLDIPGLNMAFILFEVRGARIGVTMWFAFFVTLSHLEIRTFQSFII